MTSLFFQNSNGMINYLQYLPLPGCQCQSNCGGHGSHRNGWEAQDFSSIWKLQCVEQEMKIQQQVGQTSKQLRDAERQFWQ